LNKSGTRHEKDISRRKIEEDAPWEREINGAGRERSGGVPTARPGPRAKAKR